MLVIHYILTIYLSNVLAASVKIKEQPKWSNLKSKDLTYKSLIEYGEEARCIAEDSIHFGDFFQAVVLGLGSADFITSFEPKAVINLTNYEISLKNQTDDKLFCRELHDKMPQDYNFTKLLLHAETCLNFCFCKTDLLEEKLPDKGCILLDYIFTKIENEKHKQMTNDVLKTSITPILQKMRTYTTKKTEELKQNNPLNETLKSLKLSDIAQKRTEGSDTEVKAEIYTKPEIEDKTSKIIPKVNENTKISNSLSNNVMSTKEDDENAFTTKTEKSTEQEKNLKSNNEDLNPPLPYQPDNEESYENEDENIQNTDNNVPKVEQSQSYHNVNDEYQKPIISTKYYTVQEDGGSNFFAYLFMAMFLTIVIYVIYHNKTKILALILEGRRGKSGRGRRKHTASYSKLDSNLEEAISSPYSGRSSQIIY